MKLIEFSKTTQEKVFNLNKSSLPTMVALWVKYSINQYMATLTHNVYDYSKNDNLWVERPPSLHDYLNPGRHSRNFKRVISLHMLRIEFMDTSCDIDLRRMPKNTFDYMATLVQLMAWCRQTTSQYTIQCWSTSMSPNGVTKPRWVKRCSYPDIIIYIIITR